MANIKILGNAAVVTSAVSVEALEVLKKFKPNALKLIDAETKEEIFGVNMGKAASFTQFGAIFTDKNADGKAQMTLPLPQGLEDGKKKDYVKDTYGYALLNLNKLEAQIADVMAETGEEFAQIGNLIETV